jgi:hypothetical protein
MSDHPVILQTNVFYTPRHLLRLVCLNLRQHQRSREDLLIIGIDNLSQIKPRFKSSFVIRNGDPFSITNYPVMSIADAKIVYQE